ncbi:ABC transporter permease [Syntrophorhabdus aromaticivorans]|jgi:NitT/TauT family transport system permease protein|uniref:ABC transporter permease n=1 Tax=Syntrophorhabdus aromaticivorans TaxID=328301 RepID=A0A351TZ29_9BACT|nr:ABC transporter permease [Syntrophorhabdus aromaticivorans]NLW34620.1 ABC transporter permease [Syntrophorhabdus aromaticivorans]HBA52960.1 ABC transporter permease [Syntrophorhabdus aromaticivorans]
MRVPYKEIGAVLFLFGTWHLAASIAASPIVPLPHVVFINFVSQDPPMLFRHFLVSLLRILYSLAIALAVGIPLGILFGRVRVLDELTSPLIYLIYPVPKIVFLPIIIMILGLGNLSKVFIICLIVFFQILVTTKDAVKAIGEEEVLSVKSMGGKGADILRYVILPSILPNIFTALRIAIGTCIAVLFFTESFATEVGLGYLIIDAWSKFDYVLMYDAIILMGTLGLVLYVVLARIEQRMCRWMFQ